METLEETGMDDTSPMALSDLKVEIVGVPPIMFVDGI